MRHRVLPLFTLNTPWYSLHWEKRFEFMVAWFLETVALIRHDLLGCGIIGCECSMILSKYDFLLPLAQLYHGHDCLITPTHIINIRNNKSSSSLTEPWNFHVITTSKQQASFLSCLFSNYSFPQNPLINKPAWAIQLRRQNSKTHLKIVAREIAGKPQLFMTGNPDILCVLSYIDFDKMLWGYKAKMGLLSLFAYARCCSKFFVAQFEEYTISLHSHVLWLTNKYS